jgi:hypothetical protein
MPVGKIKVSVFAMTLCLLISSPQANKLDGSKPLWDQVDALMCAGKVMSLCNWDFECSKDSSGALWEIDFSNRKIKYLTADKSQYSIEDFYFKDFSPLKMSKHAIFTHGRLMEFDVDHQSDFGVIRAQVINGYFLSGGSNLQRTVFDCHVQ